MSEENQETVRFCAMWAGITIICIALISLALVAVYRYDKRVTLAIEHGYSIDHIETYGYQSPK